MVKIIGLTKAFPGLPAPTLKHIDLTLKPTDFCILLGSNGSGKSTLMRVLSGEYSVDAGQIEINGHDMTHRDRSGPVASVVQDMHKGTIAQMTMLENIVLSMLRGRPARSVLYRQYENEVTALVATLGIGLERYLHTPMGCLSGGQRQMIATLMAVHSKPDVLLLDEHTSALDPKMQRILMEYTAGAIASSNIVSIMVTHKMEDALRYGNRLLMLHEGTIVHDICGAEKEALTVADLLGMFGNFI